MQNFCSIFWVILVIHNFIECEKETKGLSTLGTHTRCAISRTCSSVHCCLHSEVLNTNLNAFIDIDACNGKINVGIEKYQWSHKLLGYTFGEMKHVSLFGMINMKWVRFQFWISMPGLRLYVFWGVIKIFSETRQLYTCICEKGRFICKNIVYQIIQVDFFVIQCKHLLIHVLYAFTENI